MNQRTIPASLLVVLLATACGERPKPAAPAAAPAAPAAAPAAAAAPASADPAAEAAASYRVTAAIVPGEVKRGAKATLAVEIAMTRPDVHVQAEFPLKVTLTPSAGLGIARDSLGHADARDPAAKGRRWEVPVTAKAGGKQDVEVALRFAVCKETDPQWCVTRNEKIRAALEVR